MTSTTASTIRVRAYNVGFGDAFLVTVTYSDRSRRHLLVDVGSTKGSKRGRGIDFFVDAIADEIHPEGLAVLIATHRHDDHISGFAASSRNNRVDELQPKLLIQPWTDAPRTLQRTALRLDAKSQDFTLALDSLAVLVPQAKRFAPSRGRLAGLINLQLASPAALDTLKRWSRSKKTASWYVKAGDDRALGRYLPDTSLEILGPPTLEQVPFLTQQADTESEQFWINAAHPIDELRRRLGWKLTDATLARVAGPDRMGAAAWFARKLTDAQHRALLATAKSFDAARNNTSVLAILTIGQRRLLLAGDAQIENWSHTLARAGRLSAGLRDRFDDTPPPRTQAAFAQRLADIDLYKVGHHGSRNATPRTLFEHWQHDRSVNIPVVTVMSTSPGFHGERDNDSEVPRETLLKALVQHTDAYSTHVLDADTQPWLDLNARAHGKSRFSGATGHVR